MKYAKKIFRVTTYNIKISMSDVKFYFLLLLISIFIYDYMKDIISFSDSVNYKISPWSFPLLFNQKYMRCIINIGVLFLFCDVPIINKNYYYIISRSGENCWIISQTLYIFFMSGLYYFFILIISILINISHVEFTTEWGKVFQTLGSGYNIGYKTYTSLLIIHYFSPLQATFFTFLLNWLSSSLIGIIISSCNMILKGKINGIIISSFLVFFDLFVVYFPRLSWFSPVTWSNLECIKISNNSDLPSITFIIFMYILSILFIFIFNLFYHQKNKFEID